jgi:hypothetical protein
MLARAGQLMTYRKHSKKRHSGHPNKNGLNAGTAASKTAQLCPDLSLPAALFADFPETILAK